MPDSETLLREYNRVLKRLAGSEAWRAGDLEAFLGEISRAAAEALAVARVNIWLYDKDRSRIRCVEHYDLASRRHSSGAELAAADYPDYFKALEQERSIVANDAHRDPRTREFSKGYLDVHGITSMMDAPLRSGGEVIGIICHEHVGPARVWTSEEQQFAGSLADFASLAMESSERRQVEEALRANEKRTRQIFDHALDAIVVADENSRITDWNPQAEAVFGWPREDAIGRSLFDTVIPARHHENHARGMARFLEEGTGPILNRRIQITAARKNGEEFPVELTVSALRVGESFVFSAFIRDITTRLEAERKIRQLNTELEERVRLRTKQLEQANRAKSAFLATMSHELRTPMNGIIGMLEILEHTELTPEQEEYVEWLDVSANTLLRLLNNILDFSKVEAGKLELESIPFTLRKAVGETVQTFALKCSGKPVELTIRIAPDVPDGVVGDPARLGQVLRNLVGNAIKFTEEGEVVVEVELDPEWSRDGEVRIRFAVRDTGMGIPGDKLDSIFDAFHQADSSVSRRYGGTGLGLAISSQIVSLLGGRLRVESELGKGTVFQFSAPFGLQTAPDRRATRLARVSKLLAGLPVLVVDPNATSRRVLEEILSSWGMRPTTVDTSRAARTIAETATSAGEKYALAIIDAGGPGELRRSKVSELPVVALLPPGGSPRDPSWRREDGVTARLTKPVLEIQLLDAVLSVLSPQTANEVETGADVYPTRTCPSRSLRVLVAEDNVINRRLISCVLEKRGHTAVVVRTGLQALEALRTETFDIILMDVHMPELDGLEATARIRADERSVARHIPIVAMTARAMKGDRERCLRAGMDAYVAKPFRPTELLDLIEATAGGRDAATSGRDSVPRGDDVVDLEGTLARVGGDRRLLREISKAFFECAPTLLERMRGSIERKDPRQLEASAHETRGCVANFGARAACDAAAALEEMGRDEDLGDARPVLSRLEAELERLESSLRRWIDVETDGS